MREVLVMGIAVLATACGQVVLNAPGDGGIDGARDSSDPTDAPAATSCVGLAATCGPSGTGPCCESPVVAGGTFSRSYDVSGDGMFPDSSFGATLSEFRLDKYEVTVGRFRQFVIAGKGTQASPPLSAAGAHPNLAGSGWLASWNGSLLADTTALVAAVKCQATYQTWTDAPGANESRPMICVTWYEAQAFCAWDGGYLPTEAEWNYAAAGGLEQRAYPWSSPAGSLGIDDTRASWNCTGDSMLGCSAADLVAVGTNPAGDGKWGHSDLAGNAWEWTLDWKRTPYPTPCSDCAELDSSLSSHVVRGGSWGDAAQDMRTGARGTVRPPSVRESDIGFRCARAP